MTATITRAYGEALKGLISPEIVGTISDKDQEIMTAALNQSSMVWVGMEDDKVLGFCGVVPPTLISDRAYLWLYTTPALEEHKFVFIRHSQLVIKDMLYDYPLIVGHCIKGERKSMRWLEWLGAKFLPPEGRLVPFEIRAA